MNRLRDGLLYTRTSRVVTMQNHAVSGVVSIRQGRALMCAPLLFSGNRNRVTDRSISDSSHESGGPQTARVGLRECPVVASIDANTFVLLIVLLHYPHCCRCTIASGISGDPIILSRQREDQDNRGDWSRCISARNRWWAGVPW